MVTAVSSSRVFGTADRTLSFQFFGRDLLLGFDPFRCGIALFVRPAHDERSYDSLLLEPPHAEAAGGQVSSFYDLIGVGWISPELVGKIEDIGKEIRHMAKRLALPRQGSGTVLALGNGVVPVLDSPPFVE